MRPTDPNDPCPCGSGRKFRKCHGAKKHSEKRGIPAWTFFVVLALLGVAALFYTTGGGEESVAVKSPPLLPLQGTAATSARFENIPGFALADVSASQKKAFLDRVNTVSCSCGCVGDTVAKCIVDDPSCQVAPAMAQRILAEVRATEK